MSMTPIQREISNIAYYKWNSGLKMTASELSTELIKRGFTPGEKRGLFMQIYSAYKRCVEEKNQGIADCIVNCFTLNNGKYAWPQKAKSGC